MEPSRSFLFEGLDNSARFCSSIPCFRAAAVGLCTRPDPSELFGPIGVLTSNQYSFSIRRVRDHHLGADSWLQAPVCARIVLCCSWNDDYDLIISWNDDYDYDLIVCSVAPGDRVHRYGEREGNGRGHRQAEDRSSRRKLRGYARDPPRTAEVT